MRSILTLIICATIIFSNIGEAIASGSNRITVSKGSVTIILRGRALEPRDVDGNPALPFIYNGTTYLPVRAISEALGLKVEWFGSLGIISLKSFSVEVDGEIMSSTSGEATTEAQPSIMKEPSYSEEIEVKKGDIYLFLNDVEVELKDANNEPVDIIISGGTSYLPVRALANALGISVSWNGATETVHLDDSTA